jgi:hypothetical protein
MKPTAHQLAHAADQIATAMSVRGLRGGVFLLDAEGLAVIGWSEPDDDDGDMRKVRVGVPPATPGEEPLLVAQASIGVALEARQRELERIGFDLVDRGEDPWVLSYMADA